MKNYFYSMVEKVKKEFQIVIRIEDLTKLENKIFNRNLTNEQIKQRIDLAYLAIKEKYEKKKKEELIKNGVIKGNTKQVRETAKWIFSDTFLSNKLSIYGGSIPYLLTDNDSMRIIGDIDTLVDYHQMPEIRKYINDHPEQIKVLYDSLELSGEDHGIELSINGLNVSIFPTIAKEEGMVIRNFYINEILGEIEIKETLFPGIIEKDEIKTYEVDGVRMRIISPEFTYLTKEVANRQKDIADNKILETIINNKKLERMKNEIKKPIVMKDKIYSIHVESKEINKGVVK